MNQPTEPKPCPFCGADAKAYNNGVACCGNDKCEAWGANYEFYAVPIEDWNRRAVPPNVAKVIEEIDMIVGKFPGFEPESLKLQPAMVRVHTLQEWVKLLQGGK